MADPPTFRITCLARDYFQVINGGAVFAIRRENRLSQKVMLCSSTAAGRTARELPDPVAKHPDRHTPRRSAPLQSAGRTTCRLICLPDRLWIPLRREWFIAFRDGGKGHELAALWAALERRLVLHRTPGDAGARLYPDTAKRRGPTACPPPGRSPKPWPNWTGKGTWCAVIGITLDLTHGERARCSAPLSHASDRAMTRGQNLPRDDRGKSHDRPQDQTSDQGDLTGFIGSETIYRHPLFLKLTLRAFNSWRNAAAPIGCSM